MIDATQTTTDLLRGLAATEHGASWDEFDRRYRPILVNVARRMGLRDEDARDVAQETLMRFVVAYREGEYDREKGRLRTWLLGIARYRILEARRARQREDKHAGDDAVELMADEQTLANAWDAEHRGHLLRLAFDKLRTETKTNETTIRAFELLTVQQQPASSVAETLGMTTHDVYVAKSRCLKKFREILTEIEDSYTEAGA